MNSLLEFPCLIIGGVASYLCFMFVFVMLSYVFLAALWFLVCDVFLCFCHFPIWCPRSGDVLDVIDS